MLVERVNRYFTKGLKIMTNEHDSICVTLEAIFLPIYAWNLVPYPVQTSLKAWLLLAMNLPFQLITPPTSIGSSLYSPISVESYSKDLATCLSALCKVAQLLVQEHRAYHRES